MEYYQYFDRDHDGTLGLPEFEALHEGPISPHTTSGEPFCVQFLIKMLHDLHYNLREPLL